MPKNDRIYKIPDMDLLEFADTMVGFLPDDITDFSSFDSTLGKEDIIDIKQAIDEVYAVKSDDIVIDEQAELTEKVNNKLSECNKAYKTIAFFVRKAFPDNEAVRNKFGFNDIEKARNNQPYMIQFMLSLSKTAIEYQKELVLVGCSIAALKKLSVLHDELRDANADQEMFKKQRGIITQERIEKLNNLYTLLKPFSQIADIIYEDRPVYREKYILPKPKGSTNSSDDLITS